MAGPAGAAAVANTSQKGSLLIFPKIDVKGNHNTGEAIVDTIIYIGNDSNSEVLVKCVWVGEDGPAYDFAFNLAPNQPAAFSARTGGGTVNAQPFWGGEGELVCLAVAPGNSTQIQFNHLYGSFLIKSPYALVGSNAWSFRALKDPSPAKGGIAGKLPLDGVTYDACPKYVVANFSPGEELLLEPGLTLSPCRKDLRSEPMEPIRPCAKAKFDIWNANESKFTGAYQCLRWWYEGLLDRMGNDPNQKGPGAGGDKFTFKVLETFAARFRVWGVYGTGCVNKTIGCRADSWGRPGDTTPFVGLLFYASAFPSDDSYISIPYTAYPLHGAGADMSGVILWNPNLVPPE